jgi:hypothetical protein
VNEFRVDLEIFLHKLKIILLSTNIALDPAGGLQSVFTWQQFRQIPVGAGQSSVCVCQNNLAVDFLFSNS